MALISLFRQHIAQRQKTTETALRECRFDALVIGSGSLQIYCDDDRTIPFRPYHHFSHWCPARGADQLIVIQPGQKPVIYAHVAKDFWHEHQDLSDAFWLGEFDVRPFSSVDEIWQKVRHLEFAAYVGPDRSRAASLGLKTDVPNLMARLNW
jgi:hypothetical protein